MRLLPLFAIVPVLALVLAACESFNIAGAGDGDSAKGTPDTEISLRKSSVFDVVAPTAYEVPQTDVGRNQLIPRANKEAPPVIPHGIFEMLPITQQENLCVDCHGDRSDARVGPLMTPSHFTDLRNAPTKEMDEVAGARWMCLSCHMERSDATPLVENLSGR